MGLTRKRLGLPRREWRALSAEEQNQLHGKVPSEAMGLDEEGKPLARPTQPEEPVPKRSIWRRGGTYEGVAVGWLSVCLSARRSMSPATSAWLCWRRSSFSPCSMSRRNSPTRPLSPGAGQRA
jgi:hypothetical protein